MLHRKKIVLSTLEKANKLPRLALMGFIPLFIMVQFHFSPLISASLYLFGELFMCFFWIEGLILSLKIIEKLEQNHKIFRVIENLYDMEFDQE